VIDIAVAVLAYFLVSRIARGKGFRGPVPGIVAALSFPAVFLLGADAWQAEAAGIHFNLSSPVVQWGGDAPSLALEPPRR
jgi:hypothetical protein